MVHNATVRLFYDGQWNDVSADVLGREEATITMSHGRADERSEPTPATCNLEFLNSESKVAPGIVGRYTPRNPLSDLFGKISRNDRLKVEVDPTGREGLLVYGTERATTPDHASLDITGDIDVRVDATLDTWVGTTSNRELAGKYDIGSSQRSWLINVDSSGHPNFWWSTAGTSPIQLSATAALPVSAGERIAIRATLDVDDGAGNHVLTFYTADTIDGPWTQLGTPVTTAGTTSIHAGTASLDVGNMSGLEGAAPVGTFHALEVRNGIGGTLVANAQFRSQDPDDRTFSDSLGRVWTITGPARIVRPDIRFCGGIPAYPPRWDVGGYDLWVPVEAAGILRRLGQGASAVGSSLRRDLSTKTNLVAYWPMEDGESATNIAAAIGGQDLNVIGDVSLAAESDVTGSDSLPTFADGTCIGRVPFYPVPTDQRIFCVLKVPDTVPGTSRSVLQLNSSGGIKEWRLRVRSDGSISIHGWNSAGTELINSIHSVNLLGKTAVVWLWLNDDGPDLDWQIGSVEPGEALPVSVTSGTRTNTLTGIFTSITVGSGADLGGTAIGHVALMNSDVHGAFWDTINNSLVAWTGEEAHARFSRLAAEEGITGIVHGSESELMGAQGISTLLDLWQQCADTDFAHLNEYGCDGFLFRTHRELENQNPKITLDYTQGHLAPPLEPTDDDQQLRNDITVTRAGGSSAHAMLQTGTLSIDEVGRYDEAVELSLHQDGQAVHQAWWRLHLGTVDEARYPSVTIDLLRNPPLRADVLSLEPGDKIRLINLPEWLPPDDVDLIYLGKDEVIGADGRHLVTFNCAPASPWTVGIEGDGVYGRADTLNSEVAASFTSGTGTTLSVATIAGPQWTTDPAEFPFHIKVSGVKLNVTAITDSVYPLQDFTVDQTPVNGVIKEILEGENVNLANPAIAAL